MVNEWRIRERAARESLKMNKGGGHSHLHLLLRKWASNRREGEDERPEERTFLPVPEVTGRGTSAVYGYLGALLVCLVGLAWAARPLAARR